ncbi:MAG: hypothetical protein ABGY96_17030 [bacterium]
MNRNTGLPVSLVLALILCIFMPLSPSVADADESNAGIRTLVWPDGTHYVGGVLNGKRSGHGTIFWKDGTRFVGTFANDLRNGPGTMILPDGTVYNGYFKDDVLVDAQAATDKSLLDQVIAITEQELTPDDAMKDYIRRIHSPGDYETDKSFSGAPDTSQSPSTPSLIEDAAATTSLATIEKSPATDTTKLTVPATDIQLVSPELGSVDITELTTEVQTEVESMIDLWAAAWSDQNVVQYLAYYSDDFDIPDRQSRTTWEKLRRSRITRPRTISVSVDYEKLEVTQPNVVNVQLNQKYRSNLYKDRARKQIIVKKEGEFWRIISEKSL